MERSSRVLHHGNPKILFFFQKNLKFNFDLCQRAEIVQAGLNMNLYDDIGMHRRPFEGRHLVWYLNYASSFIAIITVEVAQAFAGISNYYW